MTIWRSVPHHLVRERPRSRPDQSADGEHRAVGDAAFPVRAAPARAGARARSSARRRRRRPRPRARACRPRTRASTAPGARLEPDQLLAEMDDLRRHRRSERVVQRRPVHAEVRRAVQALGHRQLVRHLARVPDAVEVRVGREGRAAQALLDADAAQHLHRVRASSGCPRRRARTGSPARRPARQSPARRSVAAAARPPMPAPMIAIESGTLQSVLNRRIVPSRPERDSARDDWRDAIVVSAGRADDRGVRLSGLRGDQLVRLRRAGEDAEGRGGAAQPRPGESAVHAGASASSCSRTGWNRSRRRRRSSRRYIDREFATWGRVVKEAGIQAE